MIIISDNKDFLSRSHSLRRYVDTAHVCFPIRPPFPAFILASLIFPFGPCFFRAVLLLLIYIYIFFFDLSFPVLIFIYVFRLFPLSSMIHFCCTGYFYIPFLFSCFPFDQLLFMQLQIHVIPGKRLG